MRYILLIYGVESDWTSMGQEEMERVYRAHMAYEQEMRTAGVYVGGAELKPSIEATTVRFEHGKPRNVDGPFAETKEQLGGYYVIEAPDMETALHWASKMPGCEHDCGVEVRPLGMGA